GAHFENEYRSLPDMNKVRRFVDSEPASIFEISDPLGVQAQEVSIFEFEKQIRSEMYKRFLNLKRFIWSKALEDLSFATTGYLQQFKPGHFESTNEAMEYLANVSASELDTGQLGDYCTQLVLEDNSIPEAN